MADAKATAYLELNLTGFSQAIATAQKLLAGLAASFAAFKVGEFFKDGIKEAINFGNELFNASQKLGKFDPGNLFLVQKALEQAGRSTEEARDEIDEFISTGRNLSDIFKGADGYSAALKQVAGQFGSEAKVLSENAEKFSVVFDTLGSIGEKLRTFFVAMTAQFLTPLQNLLEQIDKIDLAEVGEQFGKYIAEAMNVLVGAIANGTLWEIVKMGLIVAAKEFQNYMEGTLNFLADGLWKVISTVLDGAFSLINRLIGEIDWGPVATFFVGFLGKFGAALVKIFLNAGAALGAAVQTALNIIVESPKLKAILTASGPIGSALAAVSGGSTSFSENFDNLKKNQAGVESAVNQGSNIASGLMDFTKGAAADSVKQAVQITGEELKRTLAGIQIKFEKGDSADASADLKNLNDLISGAKATGGGLNPQDGKTPNIRNTETTPYKVIADSLAKVGGGGGFIRASQNILEREAVKQTRAQEQSLTVQKETLQILKAKNPSTAMAGG